MSTMAPAIPSSSSTSSGTANASPERPPQVEKIPSIHLHDSRSVLGNWFRPTKAEFHFHDHQESCEGHSANGANPHHDTQVIGYNSRAARKGRYTSKPHHIHPNPTQNEVKAETAGQDGWVRLRVRSLESEFKPRLEADVSFWIAVSFTVGSIFWVINGFALLMSIYLPYILNSPSLTETYFLLASSMAFLGGTTFEIGSYLMVVEALNRGKETNFGPALERLLWSTEERRGSGEKGVKGMSDEAATLNGEDVEKGGKVVEEGKKGKFIWWGKGLWHDLGYLAAYIQLWAATTFWISTLTGLPGVIPGFPENGSVAIVDVFFWLPQIVGAIGFILSSGLLMLEVQKKWYLPALKDVGWHIGFWNLVGSVGFLLCAGFGFSPDFVNASDISTFWGGWGFLIGSVIQLYETLWREPQP